MRPTVLRVVQVAGEFVADLHHQSVDELREDGAPQARDEAAHRDRVLGHPVDDALGVLARFRSASPLLGEIDGDPAALRRLP